jgi:hypothetical protein
MAPKFTCSAPEPGGGAGEAAAAFTGAAAWGNAAGATFKMSASVVSPTMARQARLGTSMASANLSSC